MFSYDSNPLDVFPGFELVRRHPKSGNYSSLYLKEKLEREIRDWDWKMDWLSRIPRQMGLFFDVWFRKPEKARGWMYPTAWGCGDRQGIFSPTSVNLELNTVLGVILFTLLCIIFWGSAPEKRS